MGKYDALVINNGKLGESVFKKIDERQVEFGKENIIKVLNEGIKYLLKQNLLTAEEEQYLNELISSAEISIKKDLGSRIVLNYPYSTRSGEMHGFSLLCDEFISQYNPEEIIMDLLNILCQIIVRVKYPTDEILEHERYDNTTYSIYSSHWVEYAEALLQKEKVLSCKLSFQALNYFTYKLTEEQTKILKEEFGDDYIETMILDYVDIAMSDFDGENEDYLLPPEGYIGDRIYDYQEEHKNMN